MTSLSWDEETPQQTIDRLTRELDAVTHQSRVSHRMSVYWRAEHDRAERIRARAERALKTWRKKLTEQPTDQAVTHHDLDLWAAESENPDEISL